VRIGDLNVDESKPRDVASRVDAFLADSSPRASGPGNLEFEPDLVLDDATSAEPHHVAAIAVGNIETVLAGRARGWAVLAGRGPEDALPAVRLTTPSGDVVAEGVAGEFRKDVAAAGYGTGWSGFELVLRPGTENASVLQLDVETPDGWHRTSEWSAREEAESEGAVNPTSLLSSFAEAQVGHARVGRGGLRIGSGLWLQVESSLADMASATLKLAATSSHDERNRAAVVRVEGEGGAAGRMDVRFKLGDHAHQVRGDWVGIKVFPRAGLSQPVRVNLRDPHGRAGLGDFMAPSHKWSTLSVRLPAHRCTEDLEGEVWLELIIDAAGAFELMAPEVISHTTLDPYECLNVERQRYLLSGDDAEVRSSTPFSVVIPFHGKAAFTASCVASVASSSWSQPEVILVDDGSLDRGTAEHLLSDLPGTVRLIRSDVNRGYTASVNEGVRAASHDRVIILNNDTRVTPGWDAPLLAALDDPDVFAAGPLSNAASYQSVPLQKADGRWAVNSFGAGVTPDLLATALRSQFGGRRLPQTILNGFCYAVRRETFLALGGLDEEAFPHGYGEEVDIMLRAQSKGMRSVVTPDSFVYHYKSVTFGDKRSDLTGKGNVTVRERWRTDLSRAVHEMDNNEEFDSVRESVRAMLDRLSEGRNDG
jgi:GT2 family glycosyltransferase